MRRDRRPWSFLRGLLLFLLGALVGANLVYFAMTRDRPAAASAPDAKDGTSDRIEVPLPVQPDASASTTSPQPATPMLPPPRVTATGAAGADTTTVASTAGLLIPVQGVAASQLQDTFNDARSEGRSHDAIDIMAPAGTPVLAVADGTVEKLFDSKQGGLTLYQFNADRTQAWYYAHLQGYAPGIVEKKALRRGEVIGYVGATGNASPDAPHLHFAIFLLGPEQQWWKGEAVNPYPQLAGKPG